MPSGWEHHFKWPFELYVEGLFVFFQELVAEAIQRYDNPDC